MNTAISVNSLSKSYGTTHALSNITFETGNSELFGVIGPDGAGKTTLFRIITSLVLPDSGSAQVFGIDVVRDYKKIRSIIGYMPGRFSLYQDLTVEENLDFFATVFGTTVKENYNLVKPIYSQIEPFKKRRTKDLSGGMKQKLALSCALIHRPRLLVLDEPTTGVDPVSRKEFWEMLKNLKNEGISIIVSTPYMDEASLCDRVALIDRGKIMKINTPAEIVSEFPRKLYSIATTQVYDLVTILNEYTYTDSVIPYGDSVHYTDKRKDIDIKQLIQYIEHNMQLHCDITEIEPRIEDCFMELMK